MKQFWVNKYCIQSPVCQATHQSQQACTANSIQLKSELALAGDSGSTRQLPGNFLQIPGSKGQEVHVQQVAPQLVNTLIVIVPCMTRQS